MARLRALADRPGTEHEGRAARRALRKLERRWGAANSGAGVEGERRRRRHAVVAVACWVRPGVLTRLALELPGRGKVLATRVVGGTGYSAEGEAIRASVELGAELEAGSRIELELVSAWRVASRVSVHLEVEVEGDGELLLLPA